MDDELDPTPDGLLRCLQVLAEEAAVLGLERTFTELQDAIATCREESRIAVGRHSPHPGARLVH